jgi:cation-transporting ATPase 13A3/4/5
MYIVTEDLTIVIAGFRTSSIGLLIYALVCVCTVGLGYLLLRWMPHWRVKLVGSPCTLRDCSWVVIEVRSHPFSTWIPC